MGANKLFQTLAFISGLTSIGMFLGYSLGQGTNNTALWIAGILLLLSAVLIGMSISSNPKKSERPKDEEI